MSINTVDFVNTRPEANVLSVFRHLNYTIWGALSEYVDNSVQSYLANHKYFINSLNQRAVRIDIVLDHSNKLITITDNAAGISMIDFPRAFRPAAIPPNTKGLSEFGLGMKTASCWISPLWSVTTKALGEDKLRSVTFDVEKISSQKVDDVPVVTKNAPIDDHYTRVELNHVYKMFPAITQKKIREHLSDIYRIFIRDNVLELYVNGERLVYEPPIFLYAPPHNESPSAPSIKWRKDVSICLNGGLKISGYIGILESMSNSKSGLVLFRRGRAIIGSGEIPYKPSSIFGASNSFKFRRLVGEFNLDDFSVTSQKDAFTWQEFDDGEEEFIELLKKEFNAGQSFIAQAENYRSSKSIDDFSDTAVDKLLKETATVITDGLKEIIDIQARNPDPKIDVLDELPQAINSNYWESEFKYMNDTWRVKLELTRDQSVKNWLTISDRGTFDKGSRTRSLGLSMSMKSPFMTEYLDADLSNLEPIFRLAVALGISEILARESGDTKAGLITKWINDLLGGALSKGR